MAHSHSHDHEHGHDHEHAHGDEHTHKHGRFELARKTRLRAVIGISFCFFLAEISVGFYTGSLALVADAFHYVCFLNFLQQSSRINNTS
jgi:zinc transporter 1